MLGMLSINDEGVEGRGETTYLPAGLLLRRVTDEPSGPWIVVVRGLAWVPGAASGEKAVRIVEGDPLEEVSLPE